MNYPTASSGVSIGNYYRPRGRGIKPSSAGGGLKLKKTVSQLFFILLVCLIPANNFLYAQNSHQTIRIRYDNNLISIFAEDADLKKVLFKLADNANFSVTLPDALKKKITIRVNEATLNEALKRLLSGFNYAMIYSGAKKNRTVVSEVHVYTKTKKSKRASGHDRRILNQIKAYERRIESYKNRLSKVDVNSRQGKRYLTRVRNYEKRIEKLERQLN
jgi:type II secretory pathway component GspD/PulD (secretin)